VLNASEAQVMQGFKRTMGAAAAPSSLTQSITNSRLITPICGAANPMPGASYMVSSISSAKRSIAGVTSEIGIASFFRRGSGWIMIGRMVMAV